MKLHFRHASVEPDGMIETSIIDRFAAKVDTTSDLDGCWLWTGAVSGTGYGSISTVGRANMGAHVLALVLATAEDDMGRHALHSCHRSTCVRPSHLRWGSPRENALEAVARDPQSYGAHARKLTPTQVRAIRARHAGGETQKDLGRYFGVNASTVRSAVRRETWRWLDVDDDVDDAGARHDEDRRYQRWTAEEKSLLLQLLAEGRTVAQAAARLHRPLPGTQVMAARLRAADESQLTCPRCRRRQPLDAFLRASRFPGGRCAACHRRARLEARRRA